jgi:hypothetical protein
LVTIKRLMSKPKFKKEPVSQPVVEYVECIICNQKLPVKTTEHRCYDLKQ